VKSRGDTLHTALVYAAEQGDVGMLDRAAAEYDRAARAELPEDVEAFVSTIEAYVAKGDGGADEKDTLELIAIVRKQATEIAALNVARGFVDEQAWKISEERDTLRERLAKLETAAKAVLANTWLHGENSDCPHLYCGTECDGGAECQAEEPDGVGCKNCEMAPIMALRESVFGAPT
jgi:hypothetical protein